MLWLQCNRLGLAEIVLGLLFSIGFEMEGFVVCPKYMKPFHIKFPNIDGFILEKWKSKLVEIINIYRNRKLG